MIIIIVSVLILFIYIFFTAFLLIKTKQMSKFYIENGTIMSVPVINYAESYTYTRSKHRNRHKRTHYHITVEIPETGETLTLMTNSGSAAALNAPGQTTEIYYVSADVVPPDKTLTRIRFKEDVKDENFFKQAIIFAIIGFLFLCFFLGINVGMFLL